jgi:hypothetical protein
MANVDYLNLRLEQFLDAITDKKMTYQLTVSDSDFTIEGTLSEINDFISKCNLKTRRELMPLMADKKEFEIDFEFHQIEIYNYLEKITSGFEEVKTKMVLNDIEVYYSMEFLERIYLESTDIYNNENWEIPKIELPKNDLHKYLENKLNIEMKYRIDYESMIKKTHLFDSMNIMFAISTLKKELEKNNHTEPENKNTSRIKSNQNTQSKAINKFPEIFHSGGYELFCYLNENYKGDNNSPVTKYSNLFRFLKYENKTLCTNEKYVAFIKSEYELKLSKILPETLKYTDKTQSVLTQIRINFEAQLRK